MRAGLATAPIPAPQGIPLGGNARSDKRARGVHDPVTATALAIGHDDGVVVLVQLDLIGLSAGLGALVEHGVRDAIGPRVQVVLCATHTHSAPDVMRGFGFDDHDYEAVDVWEQDAADIAVATAVSAVADLAEADLRLHLSEVAGVAFNRRLIRADGSVRMNWEPVGESSEGESDGNPSERVDEELTVVDVVVDSRTVGVIVHFALHPAILVGLDGLISGDYVHFLRRTIHSEVGEVPVLFLNGAMGDINHISPDAARRETGFAEAERVGAAIGGAAVAALAGPGERLGSAVGLRRADQELLQRVPSTAELSAARDLIAASAGARADALDGIPPLAYAHWTVRRGATLDERLEVQATVLRIGRLVFVFLPFEVFVRFGLDLRAAHPDLVAKIVSLGGGTYSGYLPTSAAFDEGGYEPTLGTSTIARGEGEVLLAAVSRLVADLSADRADTAGRLSTPVHRPLLGSEKSCQPGWTGESSRTLRGRRTHVSHLRTPQILVDSAALQHNVDAMAQWTRARRILLAPHGKTTMAPQIWQRQLDRGAWGITVTTWQQAEVAATVRVPHVQIACPIASEGFAHWIAESTAATHRPTRFLCWVDSEAGVELLGAATREVRTRHAGTDRPLEVLVEIGHEGGRTGVRGQAAHDLAAAVQAHPGLALRGVAHYEGTVAHGGGAAALAAVDALLEDVRELAVELRARVDGDLLASVGGSAYFDRVAAAFDELPGIQLMLRSGGYVTHDEGYYAGVTPSVRDAGPEFRPALSVWARVVSVPEPGLAIIDAGRRDLPYDEGLPTARQVLRDGTIVPLADCEVEALNDQHGFVRFPPGRPLAVGDVVGLGLSHPCAALDRWGALPLVSMSENGAIEVEELVWTFLS